MIKSIFMLDAKIRKSDIKVWNSWIEKRINLVKIGKCRRIIIFCSRMLMSHLFWGGSNFRSQPVRISSLGNWVGDCKGIPVSILVEFYSLFRCRIYINCQIINYSFCGLNLWHDTVVLRVLLYLPFYYFPLQVCSFYLVRSRWWLCCGWKLINKHICARIYIYIDSLTDWLAGWI